MTEIALASGCTGPSDLLTRALETEQTYFELGARLEDLAGAVLAWTPEFVAAPAASVIHRVEPDLIAGRGRDWLAGAESRLVARGIRLARLYLMERHAGMEALLSDAGFACREEIVFAHGLPAPSPLLAFRPVVTEQDWARKQAFHEEVLESPDGHAEGAANLANLERHKCAHGMEAFIGEVEGAVVGVAGAIWGDGIVRIKNLLVHPAFRRQSVATALVAHIATHGRSRGIGEQCLVALKGGAGEMLYRSLGMTDLGSCFEWSKRLTDS